MIKLASQFTQSQFLILLYSKNNLEIALLKFYLFTSKFITLK